jgi:MFS family permease
MRASALLAAASMAIAGLAPGPTVLAVAMVVAGVANGLGQPASNALLSTAVDPRRRGGAFGLKQAAIPLSVLLAGVMLGTIGVPFGWRAGYGVGAALALLASALVPSGPAPVRVGRAASPPPGLTPLRVLAVGSAFGAAGGNVLGGFLVPYAVATGLDPGQAGALSAAGSATGATARVLLGKHADRRGGRHLLRVAFLSGLGAVGFSLLAWGGAGPAGLLAGTTLAYVAGWSWAGLLGHAVALVHPGSPGQATAVTQGGVALGGAIGPLAAGLIVRELGYTAGWLFAAACAIAASALVIAGRALLLRDQAVADIAAGEWKRASARRGRGR